MASHTPATSAALERILAEREIEILYDHEVVEVDGNEVVCANSARVMFDECIWCTQAGAQGWLCDTELVLDDGGFIKVDEYLRAVGKKNVFAVGDVASLPSPRPKAGVFAVKSGPPLAANLRRVLVGDDRLERYDPQRTFLGVIGTGRPELAVASKSTCAIASAWVWDLRDWIDRKWMAQYTHDLPEMGADDTDIPPPPVAVAAGRDALDVLAHASMRCGGCGAKVGATVLSNVMRRLRGKIISRPEILVGLDSPDDCAVVAAEPNLASVHTVSDFASSR